MDKETATQVMNRMYRTMLDQFKAEEITPMAYMKKYMHLPVTEFTLDRIEDDLRKIDFTADCKRMKYYDRNLVDSITTLIKYHDHVIDALIYFNKGEDKHEFRAQLESRRY